MATRYGYEYAAELVDKRGWAWAPSDPEVCGDPQVVDPVTGETHNPYTAREIQRKRDAEPAPE